VFTSTMICESDLPNLLSMIFLPLALMGSEQMEHLMASEPVVFYEYYSKAGPRGINGYPMFFSFRSLNRAELNKVCDVYDKLRAFEEQLTCATSTTPNDDNGDSNTGSTEEE